ncbi:MAG: M48 family metalloprotease [Candidatus Omnitrophica bacterium]|nr:M48 family metalloprotease [Candidatus Omnitrophota bacterium]
MKKRFIFLGAGLAMSVAAIAAVLLHGNPEDRTDLGSIAIVGERFLYGIARAGKVLTRVSDNDEIFIGDMISKRVHSASSGVNIEDTPLQRYVDDVGSMTAANVKRKGINYRFHIVDSSRPDAFAVPGGHIYITIGLLERLKSESELAAILGHEITHVDAKHAIERIQGKIRNRGNNRPTIDDYAVTGGGMLFDNGYSEAHEDEADAGGVFLAYMAGYHPLAVINAFENISYGGSGGRKALTPVGDTLGAVFGLVGRYFATHPLTPERIAKIREYVREKSFIRDNSLFYIGERNYLEKLSYRQKRYKEELKKDHIVGKKNATSGPGEAKDALLEEVNTVHGKIYNGMALADLKKIMPEKQKAFEHEDRIGYKDVEIYVTGGAALRETLGLWIEIVDGKVAGVRLYRK